jgi:hypothetical protein
MALSGWLSTRNKKSTPAQRAGIGVVNPAGRIPTGTTPKHTCRGQFPGICTWSAAQQDFRLLQSGYDKAITSRGKTCPRENAGWVQKRLDPRDDKADKGGGPAVPTWARSAFLLREILFTTWNNNHQRTLVKSNECTFLGFVADCAVSRRLAGACRHSPDIPKIPLNRQVLSQPQPRNSDKRIER